METFKINRNIRIEAEYYETRNSWGHKAYLYVKNHLVGQNRVRYYNRTWERYTYQSIMQNFVEKTPYLTKYQKRICKKFLESGKRVEKDLQPLKTTAFVASLGDIFGDIFGTNKKESNDWKTRILKAGVSGIDIPDDWETLSEAEKEKRLNGAIQVLQ